MFNCRMDKEPPSTLMWTLFYLAQVCCLSLRALGYLAWKSFFSIIWFCVFLILLSDIIMQSYDRRGRYDDALAKINEAIEHTPTVIDLYSIKVRSYSFT